MAQEANTSNRYTPKEFGDEVKILKNGSIKPNMSNRRNR